MRSSKIKRVLAGVAVIATASAVDLAGAPIASAHTCTHSSHWHTSAYMEYVEHFNTGGNHYHTWRVHYQGGSGLSTYQCGTG